MSDINTELNTELICPKQLDIKVGNNMYKTDLENGKYVLDVVLDTNINEDKVYIYCEGGLLDTINKQIALKAGDTLHLEYTIYVERE